MTKSDAYAAYGHLRDNIFRRLATEREQIIALVYAGGTPTTLLKLWTDVRGLAWPETYGESPWTLAAGIGAALAFCQDPGQGATSDAAASYYGPRLVQYGEACRVCGIVAPAMPIRQ